MHPDVSSPRRGRALVLLLASALAPASPTVLGAETASSPPAMRIVAGDGQAGFADGRPGRFNKPIRLAPWEGSGEPAVLVADIYNHAIRIVRLDGEVRTLAGRPDAKGHRDGPAAEARFASPHGVAVSPQGRIAVAEAEGHTVRLIVRSETGEYRVTTLAGAPGEEGFVDGPAADARFRSPHAVVWLDEDRLLVADIGNARLRLIADGEVRTVAGSDEKGKADGRRGHHPTPGAGDRHPPRHRRGPRRHRLPGGDGNPPGDGPRPKR